MLQFIMLVLLRSAANGLGTSLWYALGGNDPLRHVMGFGEKLNFPAALNGMEDRTVSAKMFLEICAIPEIIMVWRSNARVTPVRVRVRELY